jgi:hypothetical protein
MKIAVDLPEVTECEVRRCAFNRDGLCHAQAITIGDTVAPMCDTFLVSSTHNHRQAKGGVGACKTTHCRYNNDFACSAEAIRVSENENGAVCETYARR